MKIHILEVGRAICGKPGVPGEWGDGDRWVRWEDRSEATCDGCLSVVWERLAPTAECTKGRKDEGPVGPVIGGTFPDDAPLDELDAQLRQARHELFRLHGDDLLRALFAWRGQGSITRWKTKPSRKLAHLADRLGREYPAATAALQKAGNEDAVASVLDADRTRRTPKGHALELARLRDELGSLGLCDYEDCDQDPTVTLPGGSAMCSHHAAVALLAAMTPDEAMGTFTFARPVPENPWAVPLPLTRALLRRFVEKWNESEKDPRKLGGEVDFDLLAALADAFEAEDRAAPRET